MTREELYRQFGPRIIEAQTELILDEINILRAAAGLQPRTMDQVREALSTKLIANPGFPWETP